MNELKKLGLTQYEIDVYKTLLKEGTLTGTKIHKLSKVPHGKTYESLVKLENKGLVTVSQTKPKHYTSVDPKISMKGLIRSEKEYLEEIESHILRELKEIHAIKPKKDEIREKINVFAGSKAHFPIVLEMYDTAKKEMKEIFTYEVRPFAHIKTVNAALKRGVKVKFLLSRKPKNIELIREDIKGVEVRYYPVDELRVVLKDKDESMEQIINPRDHRDRISIYIQSTALTIALNHYFEEIWKRAEIIK